MGAKLGSFRRIPWKLIAPGLGVVGTAIGIWQFIVDPVLLKRQKQEIFAEKAERLIEDEHQYTKVYNEIVQELPSRLRQTRDKAYWDEFERFWAEKIFQFDEFHKSMWELALTGEVVASAEERTGRLCQSVAQVLKTHSEVGKGLAELYGVLPTYNGDKKPTQLKPLYDRGRRLPPLIIINNVSEFVTVVAVPRFRYLPTISARACGAGGSYVEPKKKGLGRGFNILQSELRKACDVVSAVRKENREFVKEELGEIERSFHDSLLSTGYHQSVFGRIRVDMLERLKERGAEFSHRHAVAEKYACRVARVIGERPVCLGDSVYCH